jgi:saccharopine dehydrogenase (NAD+, L-lysine forming)
MKLGIILEGKIPPDSRTPMTPAQCAHVREHFPVDIVVQRSPSRSFTDAEYEAAGVPLAQDLSDCDAIMGVKEVPVHLLIPEKTFLFFSHTIKKQPYNRRLLQAVLEKRIRLVDYELLTDDRGRRLVAFGRFAGMVGAHNALYAFGRRTGRFSLPRMKDCRDYAEAKAIYRQTDFPPAKIVVTGSGRVASGACEVLLDMGVQQVSPEDFLQHSYPGPVFAQLRSAHYAARADGQPFAPQKFYDHPEEFVSAFLPYARKADIFINCIFYDQRAPMFFSSDDMKRPDFKIQVVADVSCDIAPQASVPTTLRASTIEYPVYGYDPVAQAETQPYEDGVVDVMAVDNLPNEMPRDASQAFGEQFIAHILPELLLPHSPVIERATIADKGHLTPHFRYLQDYVEGE